MVCIVKMKDDLNIELETIENKIMIRLDGRLDALSSHALEKKIQILIEEKHIRIMLDFSGIDYLSSAGMRLLLSVSKKLKNIKGYLVIFSLTDEVMDVIKMAGFDKILNICKSEQQAVQFHP